MVNLVITKTPLRITFAGGGTDLPAYYKEYGPGAVVSAAITKYIYVTVSNHFHKDEIRVSYSKTENAVKNINDIQHPTVRETLKFFDIKGGVQITSITEIPSQGTGLGSSSSFLVGLLNALHAWQGDNTTPRKLAEEAVHIEREVLKEAGGKQDQYMAAFGGIQLMEFYKNGKVTLNPISISKVKKENLENHMLLMYTGKQRSSSAIHINQSSEIANHIIAYNKMRDYAYETTKLLKTGDIRSLGNIMNANWLLKKSLANGISNRKINEWYTHALGAGALGGKILGAGGGGFMLLIVEPNKHDQIIGTLTGLKKEDFKIEQCGSKIIHIEN